MPCPLFYIYILYIVQFLYERTAKKRPFRRRAQKKMKFVDFLPGKTCIFI